MQAEFFRRAENAISKARLDVYRAGARDDSDAICAYLFNLQLCESLYPSLHCLEVCLRNSLHNALHFQFSAENWYDVRRQFFQQSELDKIDAVRRELVGDNKALDPGRIVAGLSFGFWTSLLNVRYEHAPRRLWPHLLSRAFPFMPRSNRTRKAVMTRFSEIRNLRNRVFHHERVIHYKRLPQQHADVIEAIGWINPELRQLVQSIDRFKATWIRGLDHARYSFGAFAFPTEYVI